MNYLVMSYTKKYNDLNNGKMFDRGSTVNISYYENKEFTDRLETEEELDEFVKSFPDTQFIFKGQIDESKIITKTKDHYSEFYDARYWKEYNDEEGEEQYDSVHEMIHEEIKKH